MSLSIRLGTGNLSGRCVNSKAMALTLRVFGDGPRLCYNPPVWQRQERLDLRSEQWSSWSGFEERFSCTNEWRAEQIWELMNTFLENVFIVFFLNWSVVDFCCTAKWLICTHLYILYICFMFISIMIYPVTLNIFLCYTAGPSGLSILYVIVYISQPQTLNPFLTHPPSPLATISLFSRYMSLFLVFCRWVHLSHILDSIYKWYHIVSVFLFLTDFT